MRKSDSPLGITLSMVIFALFLSVTTGCTKMEDLYSDPVVEPDTKAGIYGYYFDWDRVDKIPIAAYPYELDLPWGPGNMNASGVPIEWQDDYAFQPHDKRYYRRENGWSLVYSNLNSFQNNYYFALYNKYTGILRFFFYSNAMPSSTGSTTSFVGIGVDQPTDRKSVV